MPNHAETSKKEQKAQYKKLITRRTQVINQVTRFADFVNAFNIAEQNIFEIKSRLNKLDRTFSEFDEVQSQIEEENDEEVSEREIFENIFFESTGKAQELVELSNLPKHVAATSQQEGYVPASQANAANISANLPSINLPSFSGSYEHWLSFFELFKSLVHENHKLNNIQKLYYLQSCLRGDAAQIIHSLEITDANYDVAIDLLKERFENKRILIHNHVKQLFDMNIIQRESHTALRKLIDHFQKNFRALKSLGENVESWGTILVYLVSTKLDAQTRRDWEATVKKDVPKLEDLLTFLKNKCQLLETLDTRIATKFYQRGVQSERPTVHVAANMTHRSKNACTFCQQTNHFAYTCRKLLLLPIHEKYIELKKRGLCVNCLKPGHGLEACKGKSCRICHRRHNTILHDERPNQNLNANSATMHVTSDTPGWLATQTGPDQNTPNMQRNHSEVVTGAIANDSSDVVLSSRSLHESKQVLLATALVNVLNNRNEYVQCRALLDTGSQANFCTQNLFKRLGLRGKATEYAVTGINNSECSVTHRAQTVICSRDNTYFKTLSLCVIDKITQDLPQFSFDASVLNIPTNLKLADPTFNVSREIDLLLGAEVTFETLKGNQIVLGPRTPRLQETRFGYILVGPLQIISHYSHQKSLPKCLLSVHNLNEQVERFWEMENINNAHAKLSDEELSCEMHFRENTYRDVQGRYVVQLPLKENYRQLGSSLGMSLDRLHALEVRFSKNENLKREYVNFLNEYESLGHMTRLRPEELSLNKLHYYIPHHAVIKGSSTTTKLRVVFDASSKTTSGVSLNDVLKVGPKVQNDLFDIVIRMRTYQIVLTADIEKMYRMILVDEKDRALQRIVWRDDLTKAIHHYQLNTITYGTSSASFLATRTLNEIGMGCANCKPVISRILINDFYMDDLITGASSLTEALKIKKELSDTLSAAGFNLRKWMSNDSRAYSTSNNDTSQFHIKSTQELKTLGIVWDAENDHFRYLYELKTSKRVTKRTMLATVSQLFDPLGLISPVVLKGKLMLQQVWRNQRDWDESVPEHLQSNWFSYLNDLTLLPVLKLHRCALIRDVRKIDIHGFCDASLQAFGACVYIVSTDSEQNRISRLLCAKSRLAPLKSPSLPRLELCGALLASQLVDKIVSILGLEINTVTFWTDSMIVLSWLNSEPNRWKIFVSNRVAEIQRLTENSCWRHVDSAENPADLLTRGITVNECKAESKWWQGPDFLLRNTDFWPQAPSIYIKNLPEGRKADIVLTFAAIIDPGILKGCSTFRKSLHVMAYVLRFIQNCRSPHNKVHGALTANELKDAEINLCKIVQHKVFSKEISHLQATGTVDKTSRIVSLNPFLDDNNILRVGGRLRNAQLPFEQKHPIILPAKERFTRLIIIYYHRKYLHAGTQFLLSEIRAKFWPLNARNEIRTCLRKCMICARVKPIKMWQQMGDLPAQRVTPSRPFTSCGIDYAGPYLLKDGKSRSKIMLKSYLCIFICLASKAVHIELVTEMTSEAFLDAFKRFVSRRGLPKHLFTDNAKTFVGSNNYLRNICKVITNASITDPYQNYFVENHVRWHFIPARSPHFGGIWEAAVKSFKSHLKRVMGLTKLNFEQFYTVLVQVEAILNSRPICPLSADPSDLEILTPGHFLIGDRLTSIPQERVVDIPANRLRYYRHLQQLVQRFWEIWSHSYLHTLQQRSKWCKSSENIKVGAVVLLREDHLPPLLWSLGRVTSVHPGADGLVRVVTVRTKDGEYRRAVSKLSPLPVEDL